MNDRESPVRCLFIGNSYTSRNQLPRLIADLAATSQCPRDLVTQTIVAGGASLKRHWNAGVARDRLVPGAWDYVVLQEQSTLPLKSAKRYHENVRLFAPLIAQAGAKAVLYATWARQFAPQNQEAITAAVEAIAAEVGAQVVPVGDAWRAALSAEPGLALYEKDGSHPTLLGSYLAASTFLARLFGVRSGGTAVAERMGIETETAGRLHAYAWASSRAQAGRDV